MKKAAARRDKLPWEGPVPVERIYERDVDLLLAEELAINPTFADRLKSVTKFSSASAKVAEFWVSKSNNLGESDLVIVYQRDDGGRFALLIEDKVDANLQPDQADRYRMRAERERSRGEYSDYQVVLFAPAYYLGKQAGLGGFDLRISFEQLADFLDADDPRSQYRAAFLRMAAGTKKVNSWSREIDPATNAFWSAAYELASNEFPILEMKSPALSKDSVWVVFRPRDLPTMPKRVSVELKGKNGQVDLTFANTTAHIFHPLVRQFLQPGMTVHQTGGAAAIRLTAPAFAIADGIPIGLPKVKLAFAAAARLIEFYRSFSAGLNEYAKSATPEQ
jgi:hypothetical protein